uniref:Putative LOV domain-containing protein n=1 Tax=Euphorbia mesembryanthemifolia TaxID=316811 RepID=A0A126WZ60_9ROSI|nr:putative LOV domain-containing protein [Euphorbia mesembryanthemifolia]AML78462.1 putative LOV domain-containing protein [Euphorbia mesembryanthemifolia]
MEPQLALIEQSLSSRYSPWVREALDGLPHNFTITDPYISGNPIVFASSGFLKMSGYSRDEVIGRNGRMFQGPLTDRKSVMEIGDAIREERAFQINLLNYRKDGTPFWMLFHMFPVFGNEDGRVIHFVAVQVPILGSTRSCKVSFSGEEGSGLREIVFGSCRREVCSDSLVELGRVLSLDSDTGGSNIEEPCKASEAERLKASAAINNILSLLIHYSESTGKLVCGKRCSSPGAGLISLSLNLSLGRIKQGFVLTDPHLPDMPIVYASDAFLKLTGYDRHEVLGRNCRFLRGANTDIADSEQIKKCIQAEQACTVRILNYRKNKTTFWNLLHISPVRNATGKIAYYVGVQIEEGSKSQDRLGLSPEMRQRSCVGAVRVAVRTSSIGAGSSHSS